MPVCMCHVTSFASHKEVFCILNILGLEASQPLSSKAILKKKIGVKIENGWEVTFLLR